MKNIITLLLALSLLLGACALADDRADMLVAAAVNELGYSATKGGYSKYGEWGGSAYGEWCSEFVSWCVNFADEYYGTSMLGSDYPLQTSCEGGSMWYKERGRYVTVNGGLRGEEGQFYLSDGVSVADRPYIPQKGDLIYIEWYKYNRLDHVGIVEMVTQDADGTYYVHTIEGNNHILGPTPAVVQRYTYRLDDDSIRGYGVLTEGLVGWELGMGASGSQVIALQKNLKELGYYDGDCAGKLGKASVEAIKKFQKASGLDVTGTADCSCGKAICVSTNSAASTHAAGSIAQSSFFSPACRAACAPVTSAATPNAVADAAGTTLCGTMPPITSAAPIAHSAAVSANSSRALRASPLPFPTGVDFDLVRFMVIPPLLPVYSAAQDCMTSRLDSVRTEKPGSTKRCFPVLSDHLLGLLSLLFSFLLGALFLAGGKGGCLLLGGFLFRRVVRRNCELRKLDADAVSTGLEDERVLLDADNVADDAADGGDIIANLQ